MKKLLLVLLAFLITVACKNLPPIIIDPGDGCPACKILLTVDKLIYTASDTIHVTLHNNSDVPVYLEGCNPLHYATLSDTGWVEKNIRMCFWEGLAVKVEAGKTYSEQYDATYWVGIQKFIANLYFECEDDKPISEAECTGQDRVESLQFTVLNQVR